MRKRFPAPSGLGKRTFADRYAESRNNRAHRKTDKTKSKINFLPTDKTWKFKIQKTTLNTEPGFSGVFFLLISLPPLVLGVGILLSPFFK